MQKIFLVSVFTLIHFLSFSQIKLLDIPMKERVNIAYRSISKFGCFEEEAFMSSQVQPVLRIISLKKLPDTVANEVKKLKNGEYTKPIYVNESCYIIKKLKKYIFRYKIIVFYFDNSGKVYKELPENK